MNSKKIIFVLQLGFLLSAGIGAAQVAPTVISSTPGPGSVTKSAQRPQGINSPVPSLITNAHRFFLSNAGADAGLFPHPFTGTQDRPYGQFYTALQANSRFEMVQNPAEADIVLELKLTAPSGAIGGTKSRGTEDALPTFTLTLFDRPTHYILWQMQETIDPANLQKTHDKNFDDALTMLMGQLTLLVGASK